MFRSDIWSKHIYPDYISKALRLHVQYILVIYKITCPDWQIHHREAGTAKAMIMKFSQYFRFTI